MCVHRYHVVDYVINIADILRLVNVATKLKITFGSLGLLVTKISTHKNYPL